MTATLPDGFVVRVRDDVRVADHGRTLVGGSPLRAVRLSDAGAQLVARGSIEVHDDDTRRFADQLLDADLATPVLSAVGCAPHELTVVIPVRDRSTELSRALARLRPDLECIVVDDGSRDPAAVALVVEKAGAQLEVLPVNRGPAAARNAGLRRVTTPFVAFVDSDVDVSSDVLTRLCGHFEDPLVALVAPLVRGRTRSERPRWFERYDEVRSSMDLGRRPSAVRPGGAVSWLPSACMVARVDALGDGFDEALRVGEDVDLVWRAHDEGNRVRYDPDLRALHDSPSSFRGWLGRKFVYGSGGADLASRHGDRLAPAVLSPTYAVALVALLAQRRWSPLVVLLSVGRAVHVLDKTLPDTPDRRRIAVSLSVAGMRWAVRQQADLLRRHWWPAAALLAVFSQRFRRALVVACVSDLAGWWSVRSSLGPLSYLAARRLDDAAYGAGLWAGAVRARSAAVLRPRFVHQTPTVSTASPARRAVLPVTNQLPATETNHGGERHE